MLDTVVGMRAARGGLGEVGLVPTMGFLHDGHMALVARARAASDAVAVSIFVNPTQFGEVGDLERYPRDLPGDLAKLERAGIDLVFTPTVAQMYPPGAQTRVEVGALALGLEGASRPGHFAGVATVVAKLFNIVQPARAWFGQKDAQQVAVIRRMVRDLDLPVEVIAAPTVREADGLAMSSRNVRLVEEERRAAPVLFRALSEAARLVAAGERKGERLREAMRQVIATEPVVAVDYVSVADPETLAELDRVDGPALASLAARLGAVRLIDNLLLPSRR